MSEQDDNRGNRAPNEGVEKGLESVLGEQIGCLLDHPQAIPEGAVLRTLRCLDHEVYTSTISILGQERNTGDMMPRAGCPPWRTERTTPGNWFLALMGMLVLLKRSTRHRGATALHWRKRRPQALDKSTRAAGFFACFAPGGPIKLPS